MANTRGSLLRNGSTPLIIGAYLITAISGVMLFFHVGESLIKEAHEWLGMLFVAGALLHIKNHWTPFRRYFSKPLAQGVMVTAIAAGITFMAFSAGESEGNPIRAVMHTIEQAPLSLLAQLQQRDEAELVQLLEQAGLEVTDAGDSVQTLAAENNRSSREIIPLLFRE